MNKCSMALFFRHQLFALDEFSNCIICFERSVIIIICEGEMGQDISQIDSTEIRRMLQKFGKLDEDQSGALSAKEFMQIPELVSNPLVERVIDIFDIDENGEVFSFLDKLHYKNNTH